MNEKDILKLKASLTMPSEMTDSLIKKCDDSHRQRIGGTYSGRYRGLCAAAAALLCICAVGTTSFAYNVYQEKQLAVFMEAGLSQSEIDYIGQEIAEICEISSRQPVTLQYVSGDEAWEQFKSAYLTDENGEEMTDLTASFVENPLADSFHYRVSVRLNADTQAVRDQIGRLPGVRKITTVREAEKSAVTIP
ncbi:MAG: permease-like cell division protein FtsX [Lachnospiraceae bacterium]|nr:permease-like cell division protein FtsX [Lachnospiraceae bacterium]